MFSLPYNKFIWRIILLSYSLCVLITLRRGGSKWTLSRSQGVKGQKCVLFISYNLYCIRKIILILYSNFSFKMNVTRQKYMLSRIFHDVEIQNHFQSSQSQSSSSYWLCFINRIAFGITMTAMSTKNTTISTFLFLFLNKFTNPLFELFKFCRGAAWWQKTGVGPCRAVVSIGRRG